MKKIRLGMLIILLAFSVALVMPGILNAQKKTACELKIKMTGFKSNKGQVMIAVFDSSAAWLKPKKDIYHSSVSIKKLRAISHFKKIKCGTYGVAIYHDENKNRKHDTNFLGMPKEGFGFSNNAKGNYGPAKYKDAKFNLSGKQTIKIRLLNI